MIFLGFRALRMLQQAKFPVRFDSPLESDSMFTSSLILSDASSGARFLAAEKCILHSNVVYPV